MPPRQPAGHLAIEQSALFEIANELRAGRLLSIAGKRTVDSFHRELGELLWQACGMARNEQGLKEAIAEIRQIREDR